MGLHFQRNQEVPSESEFRIAGPFCSHYDGTFHGCVRQVAH